MKKRCEVSPKANKFGLPVDTTDSLLAVFSKFSKVEKVVLYGSRATGNFRPGSDIDICLVGQGLSLEDKFQIEDRIEDLLLPYKVDLSIYEKIRSSSLKEHIDRVGIILANQVRPPLG